MTIDAMEVVALCNQAIRAQGTIARAERVHREAMRRLVDMRVCDLKMSPVAVRDWALAGCPDDDGVPMAGDRRAA